MGWNCPRCGGENLDPDKAVCGGCIAEEVAIMLDDDCGGDDGGGAAGFESSDG
jgi:hypothetical protein